MKEATRKLLGSPVVAHLLAANERYNKRLGPQFAAAITYFSVLSLVPVLMFAFASLGWTVMVLRPELMDDIASAIESFVSDKRAGKSISEAVEYALRSWDTIGIFALIAAGYSGSNWIGNLKRAVRVMWSRKLSDAAQKRGFFVELGLNLATFLGLILCIALGATLTQAGSTLSHLILGHFGWEHVPGIGFYWTALSLALVFLSSWLLVAFLFVVLPDQRASRRAWLTGTLVGATGVAALQSIAGRLLTLFSGNQAVNIFGSVIALMLVLNMLASLLLMTAAWVGTDAEWREPQAQASPPSQGEIDEDDRARGETSTRWAGTRPLHELREPTLARIPAARKDTYIRQDIATRAVKTGWFTGYGVGAATGLGLGAALVSLLRGWRRRR